MTEECRGDRRPYPITLSSWRESLMLPFILLAVSAAPCEPVNGLMPLLKPGSVLFIGEIHGTNESPAFVGRAACLASGGNYLVSPSLANPKPGTARLER